MRAVLRKNILFFQHNLVSDYAFGEMHVVFCRNVLIYFGPELRQRVLGKFAEQPVQRRLSVPRQCRASV